MDAVFGAWHGGGSYVSPNLPEDLERFEDVEDAARALALRAISDGPWQFDYINHESVVTSCPAVGDDCEMHVWLSDPTDEPCDPDYIIRLDSGDPVIERA